MHIFQVTYLLSCTTSGPYIKTSLSSLISSYIYQVAIIDPRWLQGMRLGWPQVSWHSYRTFQKSSHLIKKLNKGKIHTECGDAISLLLFSQRKKSRLKGSPCKIVTISNFITVPYACEIWYYDTLYMQLIFLKLKHLYEYLRSSLQKTSPLKDQALKKCMNY